MSQNSVSVVGPRAQPQKQEKEKPDAIDQILRGLQLAQGITGIAVNYQTIQEKMANRQALDDANAGVQPAKDQQQALAQGLQPVADNTPGAVVQSYRVGEGEGGIKKQAFILPAKKADSPLLTKVTEKGPDGQPVVRFVQAKAGDTYQPYVKPEKPKDQEIRTRLITTTDEAGNEVQQIVEDKPGTSFKGAGKKPTPDQSKAALFAKRMEQAEGVFTELTDAGYNRADNGSAFAAAMPGAVQGENTKQQQQAEDNFLNAVLRRESGASISKEERASGERQYFPRAGDTPKVIEQKRQNRELATQGMGAEAGPALAGVKLPAAKEPKSGGPGEAVAAPQGKMDAQIEKYAKDNKLDYQTAKGVLVGRGYKPAE